ncbi:hypothetical protein [Paracoccus marinus]|uniref:hypothetical protein n=1 Tax=Paracoccus marinus TaxID=288426 RepID=UPI001C8F9914|nr:hypothetical protein [Paracoccus marinus]GLS79602.1 hypothetical protein GCM10007893_03760 [Paracoccus marinus]
MFGGMDVSDAKRLKAPEDESARRKRLLMHSLLDQAALKVLLSRKWQRPPPGTKRSLFSLSVTRRASGGRVP